MKGGINTRLLDMTSNLDKIIIIFKMTGCAVLGCRSNNNKKLRRNNGSDANYTKVNFHRFPKNKQMCDMWLKQCGRDYNFSITHAKICSEHFRADCYERNLQHELLSITPKCKKLKPDALPTERLPDTKRLKPKPSNYLGKRICHRRNATETNTYEDENSQPEQNQKLIRPSIVKEEKKFYNHPILPKPVVKPMKLIFVNAASPAPTPPSSPPSPPPPPSPPISLSSPTSTIAQHSNAFDKTITPQMPNNDFPQTILRSTLMLPPGTTIKHVPNNNNTPCGSENEPNDNPPNADKESQTTTTLKFETLCYKIQKHKKMNLAINKERLEIEKDRQKFHELIADKLFAILVKRGDNANSDNNDNNNLSYCNIKQEI